MVAYTKPQQRKKEESEQLRGEREIRSSLLTNDVFLRSRDVQTLTRNPA